MTHFSVHQRVGITPTVDHHVVKVQRLCFSSPGIPPVWRKRIALSRSLCALTFLTGRHADAPFPITEDVTPTCITILHSHACNANVRPHAHYGMTHVRVTELSTVAHVRSPVVERPTGRRTGTATRGLPGRRPAAPPSPPPPRRVGRHPAEWPRCAGRLAHPACGAFRAHETMRHQLA